MPRRSYHERGASLAEYAALLGLVLAVCAAAAAQFGRAFVQLYSSVLGAFR